MKSHKLQQILLFVFLLFAIWLPRGMDLSSFVTVDENRWLTRCGNFYHALSNGEFANTYQREHPGVTIMWAGAAAFWWHYAAYGEEAPAELAWHDEQIERFLRSQGYDPLDILATGRFFVVLAITTLLGMAFLLAKRLIGDEAALIAFLLIAFDPFHVALSRQLHLDGLMSSLMLLSLLAFLLYFYQGLYQGRQVAFLLLSAVAAGLAWLTRSPSLFLAPFFALITLINGVRESRSWSIWRALLLWSLIAWLAFVLAWPAMWVDPVGTLQNVLTEGLGHAAQGHPGYLFFNGQLTDGDPGVLFYPVNYLWRSTPLVLFGLLSAALAYLFKRAPFDDAKTRQVVAFLILFALLFMLFMSLGSKKFDRYLLPIFPVLSLVAGMGWMAAQKWLFFVSSQNIRRAGVPIGAAIGRINIPWRGRAAGVSSRSSGTSRDREIAGGAYALGMSANLTSARMIEQILFFRHRKEAKEEARELNGMQIPLSANHHSPSNTELDGTVGQRIDNGLVNGLAQSQKWARLAFICIIPALLAYSTMGFAPYYLSYYNPLLAGTGKAADVMMIGWGEGLDEAARYLNNKPDAEQMQVMAGYWEGAFSYFFEGQSLPLWGDSFENLDELVQWAETDYVVFYIQQLQREAPNSLARHFIASRTPEYQVVLNDLHYAFIYPVRGALPPAEVALPAGSDLIDWGEAIRLIAHTRPERVLMPGETILLNFYLQNIAPLDRDLNVLVRVLGQDGQEIVRDEGWPFGRATSTWPRHEIWTDGHEVRLPADTPSGYYRIEFSIYDPITLDSLPVINPRTQEPIGEARVVDYLIVGEPMRPTSPLTPAATLGQQLTLSGVEVQDHSGNIVTQVAANQPVQVRLFWQAEQLIQEEYTVFVHLIGPDGQLIAQQDQPPLAGHLPTRLWRPGEPIVDQVTLTLPPDAPAGAYQLRVGMYDPVTMQRLPVTFGDEAAGDSVLGATIQVDEMSK